MAHAIPAQLVLTLAALHVSAAPVLLDLHAALGTRLGQQNNLEVREGVPDARQLPALLLCLFHPGTLTERTHDWVAAASKLLIGNVAYIVAALGRTRPHVILCPHVCLQTVHVNHLYYFGQLLAPLG